MKLFRNARRDLAGRSTARREFAGLAPCKCGCEKYLHEHWRPGSDCASCGAARCPAGRNESR